MQKPLFSYVKPLPALFSSLTASTIPNVAARISPKPKGCWDGNRKLASMLDCAALLNGSVPMFRSQPRSLKHSNSLYELKIRNTASVCIFPVLVDWRAFARIHGYKQPSYVCAHTSHCQIS